MFILINTILDKKMIETINIISKVISPIAGGIESMAYHLGLEFSEYTKVYYICGQKTENNHQIEEIELRTSPHLYALDFISGIYKKKIKNKKTINFCMQYQYALGPYLAWKLWKTPYIILAHGNELYLDSNPNILKRLANLYRKILMDNAYVVIVNSNFTKNMCQKITANNNVMVVNPGVLYKKEQLVHYESFNLLSVGRLVKRKGFQNVIKALPLIREKYPVIYHIAGVGPMEKELKLLVSQMGLEECVQFHGRVSEEEKVKLFKDCEVFIMPSMELPEEHSVEGYGIVYLEANMYGKYVIATDSGGVKDAVCDGVTGTLIEKSNPNMISDAVFDYYDRIKKVFLPENAMKWAEEHSYDNVAKQYMKILSMID